MDPNERNPPWNSLLFALEREVRCEPTPLREPLTSPPLDMCSGSQGVSGWIRAGRNRAQTSVTWVVANARSASRLIAQLDAGAGCEGWVFAAVVRDSENLHSGHAQAFACL